MKVKEAIRDCGLTRAQIARDAGLSEDAVWSWEAERRTPSPESLLRLAEGLRKRSGDLSQIAEELERTAKGAGSE